MLRFVLGVLLAALAGIRGDADACPALPSLREIPLSIGAPRFVGPDNSLSGVCQLGADARTDTRTHRNSQLTVETEGPNGSGRFWSLHVTLQDSGQPPRGACVETSTVGWRTLQGTIDTPLPFTADADGDGALELVLWSSFAIGSQGTMAENAIIAWVYERDGDRLRLDLPLTRSRARDIADAYRRPTARPDALLAQHRGEAAARLQTFAMDACSQIE